MRLLVALTFVFSFACVKAQERVFVFLNSKPDKEKISEEQTAELMQQHLAKIERMAKEGKLLVAGPFDGGGGIFIFNTNDVKQTYDWLQTDPAVRANRWNIDIFKVVFDKGGACLVGEPYEMVTYTFLRLNFINDIANYKMNNNEVEGWQETLTADSVVAAGRFPQYDGGFIVHQGESNLIKENFSPDQVLLEQKKLWIARGAFCE